jgi:hypothetical protein
MARSYRWDLWAAAYIINGSCSDDGFDYFRGWLIAQGRGSFYAALADPETLVDVLPADGLAGDGVECEDMLSIGSVAYERRTGIELPFRPGTRADEPAGEPWDEEEIEMLLPRLSAWIASLRDANLE